MFDYQLVVGKERLALFRQSVSPALPFAHSLPTWLNNFGLFVDAGTVTGGAAKMEDRYLPSSRNAVHVNTRGAEIVELYESEEQEQARERDSRDIYLPAHTEWISHIAVDIGGSLAKVVYFSRAKAGSSNGHSHAVNGVNGKGKAREDSSSSTSSNGHPAVSDPTDVVLRTPTLSRPASPGRTTPVPNGVLGPDSLASASSISSYFAHRPATSSARPLSSSSAASRRRNSSFTIAGGWLNFTKFETGDMASCIKFINELIESSSAQHNIPSHEFKAKHVKIMATGGGAHLFYKELSEELGVEVRKEEEMECLIAGLTFFMEIPHEVFWYSDQLVHTISHPQQQADPPDPNAELPRPSPNPPQYSLVFDENPTPQFPCMLVNIGSGVSIIKVDENGKYERISGTSLGGGTLWGLLSMLTGAESFDGEFRKGAASLPPSAFADGTRVRPPPCLIEMLALSEQGDNANVDMLVGDICALPRLV